MRKFWFAFALFMIAVSCTPVIKNEVRHGGYAIGENIKLTFSTNVTKNPVDSIKTVVIEQKGGYRYELWAQKTDCDKKCTYVAVWNGRKPDGRWPSGGRYNVFAMIEKPQVVYSDTVEIGLGD